MSGKPYFIQHLKQDVGKYYLIDKFRKKIGAQYWYGEFGVKTKIYDNNEVVLSRSSKGDNTAAAKRGKVKLFKHFLENYKTNYMILFEDDIVPHKDFMKYFNIVEKYLNKDGWKLIYLGLSSVNENMSGKPFLNKLPSKKHVYTGAYSVIIHRSVIELLISKATNTKNQNMPFDVSCLGHIQRTFPNECFYTNPYLCIADVSSSNIRGPRNQAKFGEVMSWNLTDYSHINYLQIPMFILTGNNVNRLKNFMQLSSMFQPLIKPIIVSLIEPNELMMNYLEELKSNGIDSLKMEIVTNELIFKDKLYDLIMKLPIVKTNNYYIITNTYINWTLNINENYIDETLSLLNNNYIVGHEIHSCPIHNQNDNQSYNFFMDFMFINKNKVKNYHNINKTINSHSVFYSIEKCKIYQNIKSYFHSCTIDDIQEDIQQRENINIIWHKIIPTSEAIYCYAQWEKNITNYLYDHFYCQIKDHIISLKIDINELDNILELSKQYKHKFVNLRFRKIGYLFKWTDNVLEIECPINKIYKLPLNIDNLKLSITFI